MVRRKQVRVEPYLVVQRHQHGGQSPVGPMLSLNSFCRLRSGGRIGRTLLIAPIAVGVVAWSAAPLRAAERTCQGTVLQIKVHQTGTTRSERFRFSLALEADASTKAQAMALLNERLEQARQQVKPLALGRLTIPAPRSYADGGGQAGPRREKASTSISGEVNRANYDAMIQLAGRLPGVRLRGMTSIASGEGQATLHSQLLKQALEEGKRQAETMASALGLRRVELLRINQRGQGYRPVALASMNRAQSFKPGEAPRPSQSIGLELDYCLQ